MYIHLPLPLPHPPFIQIYKNIRSPRCSKIHMHGAAQEEETIYFSDMKPPRGYAVD